MTGPTAVAPRPGGTMLATDERVRPTPERVHPAEWCLLGLYSVGFFTTVLAASLVRPLWYDELFTVLIARQPGVVAIWRVLAEGADPHPPLSYWCVHVCELLLGPGPLATRLPAMVGFWVMGLCLYAFLRRRGPSGFAWVGLLFPLVTGLYRWGFEARGYGLVLGACGLSLLGWQLAADGRRRVLGLALLVLGLALGVASHYYAVLLVIPLAAGEAARTVGRRRVDLAVWLAMGAGLAPLLALAPLIRAARQYSAGFWGKPAWMSIPEVYTELLTSALPPLVVWLVVDALVDLRRRTRDASDDAPARSLLRPHEVVAAAVLVLLPVFGVVLGKVVTNAFTERYVLATVIGVALLVAAVAYRATRGRTWGALVLAALLLGWFAAERVAPVVRALRQPLRPVSWPAAVADGLEVLTPDAHLYLEAYVRLEPARARDLVYVGQGDFTDTRSLRTLSRWEPVRVVEFEPFLAAHRRFHVYVKRADDPWSSWLLPALRARGARLELEASDAACEWLAATLPP